MNSLLYIAAFHVAAYCSQGHFETCVGLLQLLPLSLVKKVYHHVPSSDAERDVAVNPKSYLRGFREEDWTRLQRIALRRQGIFDYTE
jgi:hypothetical protein